MEKQKKENKKVKKLLLSALFGITAGFLVLETSLRVYYFLGEKQLARLTPSRTTIEWQDDELLGKVLIPNQSGWFTTPTREYFSYINVNSQGWRDGEHSFKKPENTYRIAILGDSFVESFQVPLENTFFRQLENKLNEKNTDVNFEVLAFGMGDTGTAQQLLVLKEIIPSYNPNLVIQMFLTSNDVSNNHSTLHNRPYLPHYTLDASDTLKLMPPKIESKEKYAIIKKLMKKSRLVEKLLRLRHIYTTKKAANSKKGGGDYPSDLHIYDETYTNEFNEAVKITKKLLKESEAFSASSGFNYLLVTLANNEQVHDNVWNYYLNKYPEFAKTNPQKDRPEILMNSICIEYKIDCLFMLSYFQKYIDNNPDKATHYLFDGHWNQTGNDLAAKFLYENLKDIVAEEVN